MEKWKFLLLMLFIAFMSCQSKDVGISSDTGDPIDSLETIDIEGAIRPLLASKEVKDFFEIQLQWPDYSLPVCFFVNEKKDTCIMINSMEEFEEFFSCSSFMLPILNFDSCTLIIGHHYMIGGYYTIVGQYVIIEPDENEFTIIVDCPGGGTYAINYTLYYWGLYPKIENNSISYKLINKCRK